MEESNEGIEGFDTVGSVIEVDLDAETEEVEESADPTSEVGTVEDPQEVEGDEEHPESEEDAETQTPSVTPFSFSADGTQFDVPGAVVSEIEDPETGEKVPWIAMPKNAWQEAVQPQVGDRRAWQRTEAAYKRQLADLDPVNNPTVVEAQALLESWGKVLELEPDELGAWLENAKENMDRLKLEAENKALRAERERESNVEPDYTELREHLQADVPNQVAQSMQRLGVNLPANVQKEVANHLWSRMQRGEAIYVQGTEYGLPEGEVGVLLEVIDDAVQMAVGRRENGARDAERKNAPKPKPPRTVATKGSPAPSSDSKEIETKDDWLREMGLN